MKRFVILLAACGPASHAPPVHPPPPPPSDTITLAYHPPAVGTTWRDTEDMSFDFTMPKIGAVHTGKHEVKTIEIVKVEGELVTAKRVAFESFREQQAMQGHQSDQPSALDGKRYLIEDAAGGPVVHTTDGGDVPPDEAALVLKDEHVGARDSRFARALAGKTFRLGEEVELTEEELAGLLGDDPIGKARFTMTYRGPEGDGLAGFDVTISATSADNGTTTAITLTGRVLVDPATADATDGQMQGPMQTSGTYQAVGTMTLTTHRTSL